MKFLTKASGSSLKPPSNDRADPNLEYIYIFFHQLNSSDKFTGRV